MAKSADYSLGPHTFPRGWFVIAESSELGKRGTKAVRFFGKDFALYRGDSGSPAVLDAYCPHMGTHLTASKSSELVREDQQIQGDDIRCPYHGWRFGPDGTCQSIPYHHSVCPKAANMNAYYVDEVMGCIMMWHDPEGNPPDYAAPELSEWHDPQWVRWTLDHLGELDVHPQEILDNMSDPQHLSVTHGAICEFYENEFRDHICIQRQGGYHDRYHALLESITWYTGPGILLSKQSFGDVKMYQFIANTPVEDGKTKLWHGVISKVPNDSPTEVDRETARQRQADAMHSLASDFDVWQNKQPATNILQLPEDGPFDKGRKWYKQFYDRGEHAASYHQKRNGVHRVKGFEEPPQSLRDLEGNMFADATA